MSAPEPPLYRPPSSPPPEPATVPVRPRRSSRALVVVALGAVVLTVLVLGAIGLIGDGRVSSQPDVEIQVRPGLAQSVTATAPADVARRVYRKASPSTVTIRVKTTDGESLGSGFFIDDDGYILTNSHVVDPRLGDKTPDLSAIRRLPDVEHLYVDFTDGRRAEATLVGEDPNADLALLRIKDATRFDIKHLEFADLADVSPGDTVFALGSPFGNNDSFTVGVVSALDRTIQSVVKGYTIPRSIQTDAAINRGNSGGPLLDTAGRVVGINAQLLSSTGANDGVGYAISSQIAIISMQKMRDDPVARYPLLGVTTQTLDAPMAKALGLPARAGAIVESVNKPGPAADSGLRVGRDERDYFGIPVTVGGDIITAIGTKPVTSSEELIIQLLRYSPGDRAPLKVVGPDRKTRTVLVTLGERGR